MGTFDPEHKDLREVLEMGIEAKTVTAVWPSTVLALLDERDALTVKVEEFTAVFELQARGFRASEARVKNLLLVSERKDGQYDEISALYERQGERVTELEAEIADFKDAQAQLLREVEALENIVNPRVEATETRIEELEKQLRSAHNKIREVMADRDALER